MAYTEEQIKKLRSSFHSFRQQREFFKERLEGKFELLPQATFRSLTREVHKLNSWFPGLIVEFDERARGTTQVLEDGAVLYRLDVVIPYLSQAIARLEVELEEGTAPPVIEAREFAFVTNSEIRRIVERDYREIQRAFISQCWKAVVILAGGLIEAILLDALSKRQNQAIAAKAAPKGSKDFVRWNLSELIEVVIELGIVSESVAKVSHAVREYRNLVHPGNEFRNRLSVAKEEARIAIEVLHILHRDLTQ